MKYLIVQDWGSTHGNHAGMVHMCNLLKDKYPSEYEVLIKESVRDCQRSSNFILDRWYIYKNKWFVLHVFPKEYMHLCAGMFDKLKENDEIFLLEYCLPSVPQFKLAQFIRKRYPHVKIYALSHLTPTFFKDNKIYPRLIRRWSKYTDKMLTLGSSLSTYMISNGCESSKVNTGFHYVDSEYYRRSKPLERHGRLKIITMGAMQRNTELIAEIAKSTPMVDWIICCGRKKVDDLFMGCDNVTLKGFLNEDELRQSMEDADVSLNVMEDTVGSNVVTTSLAMGLAMVCSDVGSVRDYCNERNTIFCDNTISSFTHAVEMLANDLHRVHKMKMESLKLSEKLSIENVHKWFSQLRKNECEDFCNSSSV